MDSLHSQSEEQDEKVKLGLVISLAVHAALISFLFLRNVFINFENIDYQSAVRVDIVALPDKLPEDFQPPPKVEEAATTPPEKVEPTPAVQIEEAKLPAKQDPEKINLDKTKQKQLEALAKLKSNQALENLKKKMEQEKKMAGLSEASKAQPTKIKGNILSAGTELKGLNKLQHDNFVADLDRHIKQNWALPQWLANKNYRAQVLLKIDEKGNILFRQIFKTSGNQNYDDVVLDTIDRSAPFPAPPEKFIAIVGVKGILIGFPE